MITKLLKGGLPPEMKDFALNNSFDIVIVYDSEERILFWNTAAEECFGLPREKAVGSFINDLWPALPGGRHMNNLLDDGAQNSNSDSEGGPLLFRRKILTWKGRIGETVASIVIAKYNGIAERPLLEQELLHEMLSQQHKELEEKTSLLQAIFDTSLDYIGILDTGLRYVNINRSFEQYLAPHVSSVRGRNMTDVFPHHLHSKFHEMMLEALQGKAGVYKGFPFSFREGFCNLHTIPLRNEDGVITGVMHVIQDVTELTRLNSELNDRNTRLEQINIELSNFASAAHHDLSRPLNKIRIFTELLLEREMENLSDGGREYLRRLEVATKEAESITSGTIDYYAAFRQDTIIGNVLLSEIIEPVIKKYALPREHLSYSDLEFKGNPGQLSIVFDHLISNAMKFRSFSRALCITIGSECIKKPTTGKKQVSFTVSDNGIGFKEEYNEKVFDVFFRVNSHVEYSGNGIGLSICKKIISNQGGTIIAEGKEGEGTTILISLPQ